MIRLATPDDAGQIAQIYAPYVLEKPTSFELIPPTEPEMREQIKSVLASKPWLVYEENGEVLGYVYASAHRPRAAYRWSVDVTVYIHKDHHRRGVGRALYTSLFEILRTQGYATAYAGITLPNESSAGLHESMGFSQVGIYHKVGYKFGKWHDVGWWELALGQYSDEPSEPTGLDEVIKIDGWAGMLR